MVKIQSATLFTELEEEKLSVLASIARLSIKQMFYTLIGRKQAMSNPVQFHLENLRRAEETAKKFNSNGLRVFCGEMRKLLESKI